MSGLASHAAGKRSGDQFCVYVADRLVLPSLTPEQVRAIGDGALQFDALVRSYVCDHLAYRLVVVASGAEARRLEDQIKRGVLSAGAPLLKPRDTRGRNRRYRGLRVIDLQRVAVVKAHVEGRASTRCRDAQAGPL
jgi:hypothetical protein